MVDSQAALSVDSMLAKTAGDIPVLVWASQLRQQENVQRLVAAGCRVAYASTEGTFLTELMRRLS